MIMNLAISRIVIVIAIGMIGNTPMLESINNAPLSTCSQCLSSFFHSEVMKMLL